jgi:hypothetical protein
MKRKIREVMQTYIKFSAYPAFLTELWKTPGKKNRGRMRLVL